MLETHKNSHKKTRTKHVTNIHIQEGGINEILKNYYDINVYKNM